ncbi:MAG: methyltransferase domain-containing protein [Lachnospiraceae bacterium]|nr:methyltransferase domain-containing protein [Lachnospiraceae bacterium]
MIHTTIKNIPLQFHTNDEAFSPNAIDTGTLAMLSLVDFKEGDKVLDLGCGYGVVGILAAKSLAPEHIFMCDISDNAVSLSNENAALNKVADGLTILKSDGLREITEEGFTMILSNPPYHADFSVPKHFIEEGYRKLAPGGTLYMVTKRRDWYKNKIISVFGGVTIKEIDGYQIFIAKKQARKPRPQKPSTPVLSKKLQRKLAKKR